ncbi:MAG: hypothetical protein H0U97_10790 [Gammaproteobacteria bacterium]|nr:hypothetical protein [Gammaproteobacteria bacterium]
MLEERARKPAEPLSQGPVAALRHERRRVTQDQARKRLPVPGGKVQGCRLFRLAGLVQKLGRVALHRHERGLIERGICTFEQEVAKQRMNFIDGLGRSAFYDETIAALEVGEHPSCLVIAGEPLGLPGRDTVEEGGAEERGLPGRPQSFKDLEREIIEQHRPGVQVWCRRAAGGVFASLEQQHQTRDPALGLPVQLCDAALPGLGLRGRECGDAKCLIERELQILPTEPYQLPMQAQAGEGRGRVATAQHEEG